MKCNDSFVYFLVNQENTAFKVGVSVNTVQRMKILDDDFDLSSSFHLSCSKKDSYKIEKTIHFLFRNHHSDQPQKDGYTEWFDIACFEAVSDFVESNKDKLGYHDLKKVELPPKLTIVPQTTSKPKLSKEEREKIYRDECIKADQKNLVKVGVIKYWLDTMRLRKAIIGRFTWNGSQYLCLKSYSNFLDGDSYRQYFFFNSGGRGFYWIISGYIYSEDIDIMFCNLSILDDSLETFGSHKQALAQAHALFSEIPLIQNQDYYGRLHDELVSDVRLTLWG